MVVLKRAAALGVIIAAFVAAAPACTGAKCGDSDVQCFLDNMVIVPPQDGAKPQKLTSVPDSKIARPTGSGTTTTTTTTTTDAGTTCPPGDAFCPGTGCTYTGGDPKNCGGCGKACDPRQICDGAICQCAGDNPNCLSGPLPASTNKAPSITSTPKPISFPEPQTLEDLDLPFADPNGCQPAFCARLCKGKSCTSRSSCAPPVKDGLTAGTWRSYLGFLAQPPDTTDLTLGFTPISAPGCPADLLDQLANGTIVADVGAEVTIQITVTGDGTSISTGASPGTSSGTGTSGNTGGSSGVGTQCSPVAATCNCSLKACSDGSGCWYETSNGRFNCASGCNCQAAAQSAIASCCPKP
jgi:hypothetical protein